MKKKLHPQKSLFALLLALFVGMGTANAVDFYKTCSTGQTLYYNIIDAANNYVEITCPGTTSAFGWDGYTKPTGNITLPSNVTYNGNTYTVKRIGQYAFVGCSGLTGSLSIPNSVTEIGRAAFNVCEGFTGQLTLGNSVTTIGVGAFMACEGISGLLTIPNSVTTIDDKAFYLCSGITSMTVLPETPPTLGHFVFDDVTTSIPVYVPCGSLSAYQNAFGWSEFSNIQGTGCSSLTYSINDDGVSVTVTGHVDGTSATGSLSIPMTTTIDGVTYTVTAIGNSAFKNCSGLTGSLSIPNSVTSIGNSAFYHCTGFTGQLIIPNSVTTIGSFAFYCCTGFTGSLTIPNSVTSIGSYAFYYLNGLTGSLKIGNAVTSISNYAFAYCRSLSGSLTIGYSVTTIGDRAFQECYNVTSITVLPETPPTLGTSVFQSVPTDILVEVPCESLEDYQTASGWSAFTNIQCRETLTYSVNYNGVYYYVSVTGHVDGTAAVGRITIPSTKTIDGVTYTVSTIERYAFRNCTGLTGPLIIPESVTTIAWNAFDNCSGFTGSLTIPNSVTTIGSDAFRNCTGFTGSLTISNSVTEIASGAFDNCSGFTGSLTIPNSVNEIYEDAFRNCSGFTGSLTIPNSVTTIGSDAFNGCTGFTGSLTIGSSVTTIGERAFHNCSGFTGSLTIPNSVNSIDLYAFRNCTGFDGTLTIGNSLTTIGYGAFSHCSGFTGSLTIPNSVTTIGTEAFYGCSGFTGSLTIPNSVTTIGNSAFRICFGFNGSLTIGSSVTNIGSYAFEGCSDFASMTVLPETPPTLGTDVFSNVPSEIPVYVPCESLEDYQADEGWSAFTNMQCRETLTVYDGTATNFQIPAYITYFDDFTRSQFVIPADELVEMIGTPITSMTFYTTTQNVPYTTLSDADVYLMEVDYTSISAYEPKESATTVYSGRFSIVSADDGGGMMTIYFSTPYVYQGGNLLVGIENVEDNGFKYIVFYGQTVSGASISGRNASSTGIIPANQQNFIPKTTFGYQPTCVPKRLPYTYGFEEEDKFECWTMLDCDPYTGRSNASYSIHQGDYGFRFYYNTNPPQYLISPELKGTTGVDVSFYYKNYSNSYPETFQVGYSTTTQSPTAFTWGDEVTANDQTTWMLYEDFFPVGTKYVAVKYNSYDQWMLFLDDFSFEPNLSNIFLTDGYWNDGDNWNIGEVPEEGSDVIIQANVTVPAGYLAVANAVSLDGGSITVADGGQLKHNTLDLMVTMKKNIAGYDDANSQNNYYLLAVPFLSVQVPTAMTANPGSDFYRFDPSETGAEWRNHKEEPITFVQRRYGYLYANPESVELSLTGITLSVSNEFTMNYTVDYTEGSSNPSNGWALLGNPFTYNAYVYRFDSNNEFVPMPIMMYDEEGELQTIYGGPVAPMQGFFVHVTETTTVYFSGTGIHEDDYVDLGLPSGLLWATCNIGANAPEEYGDYFAWGETTPKDTYTWSTYQYCNGSSSTLTKYCTDASYGYNGFTDNLTTLLPEDDAAAANWGGNWRMPTQEEFQELYNNTTVTWTQQNGVNGRLFTASNGNSLFLPAAGYRWSGELNSAGSYGDYWSSSLYAGNPGYAWSLDFGSGDYSMGAYGRFYGQSVRPVRSASQN